jgi:hypothetical protein
MVIVMEVIGDLDKSSFGVMEETALPLASICLSTFSR